MTRLALLLLASCAAAQATDKATAKTTTATTQRPAMERVVTKAPTTDHLECGDTVLNDQLTTGGTGRVTSWQPCFDVTEEQAVREHAIADADERQTARHERHAAAQLVQAQAEACRGIPEREREHSVFAHKSAIAARQTLPDGTVRVTFKPVRGLTKTFVERDIGCARARWAVSGRDPALASTDPTLADGADVHVTEQGDHVVVTVRSATPPTTQVSLP